MLRAIQIEIPVRKDIVLDAYKLQNDIFERRLGVTGASTSTGHSREWLGRLLKQDGKQLKAMQADGFKGCIKEVLVPRPDGNGSSIAKTISLRDFNKILAYEAINKKNVKAIILLVAAAEGGFERLLDDAFAGESLDWFGEKIVHYSQWTNEELMAALQMNYDDWNDIHRWEARSLPRPQGGPSLEY